MRNVLMYSLVRSQCEHNQNISTVIIMKIESARHIHAALLANGQSCRAWAITHGYNPRTVQKYVQWFAPNTGRKPKRLKAVEIMAALSDYLGVDLVGERHD